MIKRKTLAKGVKEDIDLKSNESDPIGNNAMQNYLHIIYVRIIVWIITIRYTI